MPRVNKRQPPRTTSIETPAAKKTGAPKEVRAEGKKNDGFEKLKTALVASAGPAAEAAAPAVLRAAFTAASQLGSDQPPQEIASEAARTILSSPEMMAAFKHALPALEATVGAIGGSAAAAAAGRVLPLLANKETTKAILKLAFEVGGIDGRRLAGAALRGLAKGGIAHSAAEVTATAVKVGAKAGAKAGATGALGAVAKGLGKAAPIIGNAANILSVGTSLVGLIKALKDGETSLGKKLAHALHLACSVAGCFIPPVGTFGDLAMAGVSAAGVK